MNTETYQTGKYKLYAIKDGLTYSPDGMNCYELLKISIEKALELYHHRRTIMLTWKNKDDGCIYSTTFVSDADKMLFSKELAAHVYNEVANKFSIAIAKEKQ